MIHTLCSARVPILYQADLSVLTPRARYKSKDLAVFIGAYLVSALLAVLGRSAGDCSVFVITGETSEVCLGNDSPIDISINHSHACIVKRGNKRAHRHTVHPHQKATD